MRYRRWAILAIGFPIYVVLLAMLATLVGGAIVTDWAETTFREWISDVGSLFLHRDFVLWILPITAGLAVLQVLFVIPVFAKSPPRDQRSKSLTFSLLVAGVVAGVLCFGAGTGLAAAVGLMIDGSADPAEWLWLAAVLIWLGGWAFWTIVILLFTRRIWPDQVLGRIVGVLLGGTAVEMIAVIPLDVMIRRRTDCYCATGTFFTLIVSAFSVLWLAGPGIVIALTSKRYRLWRTTHCGRCGYPKGPSPGLTCPECGFEWNGDRRASRAASAGRSPMAEAKKGG